MRGELDDDGDVDDEGRNFNLERADEPGSVFTPRCSKLKFEASLRTCGSAVARMCESSENVAPHTSIAHKRRRIRMRSIDLISDGVMTSKSGSRGGAASALS